MAEPAGDAVNGEWRELGARAELLKSTSSARAARRPLAARRTGTSTRRLAEHVQRPASVGAGVRKGAWRRRAAARCAHAERVCSGGVRLRDGARARVRGARLRRKLARCNARECSHRARWRVLYGAWHLPISRHTMRPLRARDGGEQAVGTLMEVSDGSATRSCVVEQR